MPALRPILLLLLIHFAYATNGPDQAATSSPAQLTAEQDHQRLLDLLHIPSLRRGPDGDPKSPDAANFDESKVAANIILPDPLLLKNGQRVTSAAVWWNQRRPEIVEEFDREVYGRVPAIVPRVAWQIASETRQENGGVPVLVKHLIGHVDNSSYPAIAVDIQLTLTTPVKAAGPVAVIMEFDLSPKARAALEKRFPDAFHAKSGPTWQQQVLARGWGYAELIATSIQADSGEGLTQGIIGLVNRGQPRNLDDWGALRAWAWGASRALDYFETDQSVDAKKVGIEGLSRYGKAALVAMAYDQRFAVGFIGSSGAGGAKILRRNFGEQVENIASTSEYHWMDGNFLKYAGPLTVNDLPVDAHELIALCAPRPVFISSGSLQVEGGWVDAKGMFLAAVAAGSVYRLLGEKDLGATEMPPIETALIQGGVAFRQHSGGHTTGPNWPAFLIFASRYLDSAQRIENGASAVPHETGDEVALTFDDLPSHGPLLPGLTRVQIADSLIHALQTAHAPPIYGFVNAKRLEEDPATAEVLKRWRQAGFPLGNHTFSHMNLNENSLAAWEQDLLTNEPTLQKFMGDADWHWLRFPYLREGDTLEKHISVMNFLKSHGYKVAEVTLNFDDYAYNEPYARCLEKNNQAGIDWLKQSYLNSAADSLTQGQKLANLAFGRPIRHVMLLHIGGFETVMLPALLDLLRQRNFRLITLPQAESDSAYATDLDLASDWSGTFLDQVLRAKRIPNPQPPQDERFAKLNAICR